MATRTRQQPLQNLLLEIATEVCDAVATHLIHLLLLLLLRLVLLLLLQPARVLVVVLLVARDVHLWFPSECGVRFNMQLPPYRTLLRIASLLCCVSC